MNGKYLLDTNIIIALFAADLAVTNKISTAKDIFIPAIAIGELFYGTGKSSRVKENAERIEEFVSHNVILSCDTKTAYWYGKIKNHLREKGCPIPENDIWIAAISAQHNLILVSRDEHFREVASLKLEKW
uniref:tRNA(fMet)-specific endonuclease VapC n=1 Tax=Candidatus Kentrum sp. FW TaxID=2126338 RepID=A0A450RZ79_9GAMM|nr:MAG: tRNA(fMet)-specific endonuclease VapC [Candidatus Kentron sp. FW]